MPSFFSHMDYLFCTWATSLCLSAWCISHLLRLSFKATSSQKSSLISPVEFADSSSFIFLFLVLSLFLFSVVHLPDKWLSKSLLRATRTHKNSVMCPTIRNSAPVDHLEPCLSMFMKFPDVCVHISVLDHSCVLLITLSLESSIVPNDILSYLTDACWK